MVFFFDSSNNQETALNLMNDKRLNLNLKEDSFVFNPSIIYNDKIICRSGNSLGIYNLTNESFKKSDIETQISLMIDDNFFIDTLRHNILVPGIPRINTAIDSCLIIIDINNIDSIHYISLTKVLENYYAKYDDSKMTMMTVYKIESFKDGYLVYGSFMLDSFLNKTFIGFYTLEGKQNWIIYNQASTNYFSFGENILSYSLQNKSINIIDIKTGKIKDTIKIVIPNQDKNIPKDFFPITNIDFISYDENNLFVGQRISYYSSEGVEKTTNRLIKIPDINSPYNYEEYKLHITDKEIRMLFVWNGYLFFENLIGENKYSISYCRID